MCYSSGLLFTKTNKHTSVGLMLALKKSLSSSLFNSLESNFMYVKLKQSSWIFCLTSLHLFFSPVFMSRDLRPIPQVHCSVFFSCVIFWYSDFSMISSDSRVTPAGLWPLPLYSSSRHCECPQLQAFFMLC